MSKGRGLRPDEQRLWARIAAGLTPRPGRRVPEPEAPAASAKASQTDSPPAVRRREPLHGQAAAPKRAGPPPVPDRSGERRVRRGKIEPDLRLDLHGLTVAQARTALQSCLAHARARGARCVLVITGKGDPALRSYGHDAPGVLRRGVPDWLEEPGYRELISGAAPAHRRHGGGGALYVFLKRPGDAAHRPGAHPPHRAR